MVKEVIGFDIGHGESAVAQMALLPLAKPRSLDIDGEKCQITAVGNLPNGEVAVGEQVFRDSRVANVRLGFKQRPPGTTEANNALRQFVREYHRRLVSSKQILGGELSHYFVGCPSGWTQDEQEMYRSLLAEVLPAVSVVRESRAALLEARDVGQIGPELIKGTILVIDAGSSTTDVSLIVGGIQDKRIDFGRELGAHLIDKAILDYAVLSSPHRADIEQLFVSKPDVRTACERSCRRAKEEFWKGNEDSRKQGTRILIPVEFLNIILDFRLDSAVMDSILTSPCSELGELSWVECFKGVLEQVRELLAKRISTPGILVLTGGPSRMSFIRCLCEEYFPPPETTLVWSTPPEETVALGLARWGGITFQTSGFIDEVEIICSKAVPETVNFQALDIKERLANEVSAGIARDIVGPLLKQWRSGALSTLDTMQGQLKTSVEAWFGSPEGREAIQRAYTEPLREIYSAINSQTLNICVKHGISHSSLLLEIDFGINGDQLQVPVESPFDTATGIVAGISFAVLVVLTGIAKGALLTVSLAEGPPGWLVAALLAAWISVFGTMALHSAVSGWNFPLAVRRLFLSDARYGGILDDTRNKLRESLAKSIGDSELEKIKDTISQQVSKQLRSRAEEIRWIIS